MSDIILSAITEPKLLLTIQNPQVQVQPDFSLTLEQSPLHLTVGLQGQKGDTGDTGPMGPQGLQGPIGPAGADGLSFGFDATDTLSNQSLYDAEAVGFRLLTSDTGEIYVRLNPTGWSAPIQLRGAKGDTGAQGPQGVQGIQGPQGNPGLDGEGFNIDAIDSFANLATYAAQPSGFAVVDPATGLLYLRTDTPGEWTNGIQFVGPEGPQGPAGPQGLQGPAGVDGQNGADFAFDAVGPLSERNLYNSQAVGFTFLDTDNGNVYVRRTGAIGTWTAPLSFTGPAGPQGDIGDQGDSAYTVAVNTQGFLGTEAEWLTSISAYGIAVANGFVGTQAQWLASHTAYGVAVSNGYLGTESEWLRHITAYGVAVTNGYTGTEQEWLDSLSGYGIAQANGFLGTQAEWLTSLIGPQGNQGIQGLKGDTGQSLIPDAISLLADLGTYNNEPEGFVFMAVDTGEIYFRATATPGTWSVGVPFRGPEGLPGDSTVQSTITSATYTILDSDLFTGREIKKVDHLTGCEITVPPGLTNKEPCTFIQKNDGPITFVTGTGVLMESADLARTTRTKSSFVTLFPDDVIADLYYLTGDIIL